jgi:hypothetical protein
MESSASDKLFVFEGCEPASCAVGSRKLNESEVGVMSHVMKSAFSP